MVNEQQQTIDRHHLNFIERHSNKIGERLDENLRMRDEFAAENSYKFSDLLITIAIGIIGIASLSDFHNLEPLSKVFSTVFVLPVIVVILEINFRRKVIEVNRAACDKRAKKLRENGLLAQSLLGNPIDTFDKLSEVTKQILESEDEGYKEIIDWVRATEPPLFRLRRWSFRLLVISLIGMVAIILNENGGFSELIRIFININISAMMLNQIGLILDIAGVVILSVPILNHVTYIDDTKLQGTSKSGGTTTPERLRYRRYGFFGLAITVLGFILQLIANSL